MLMKELDEVRLENLLFLEEALVDDSANVRRPEVHPQG
jgi:hypothetical protein